MLFSDLPKFASKWQNIFWKFAPHRFKRTLFLQVYSTISGIFFYVDKLSVKLKEVYAISGKRITDYNKSIVT